MGPRGLWMSSVMGRVFMVSVVVTLVANYALAVLCEACYDEGSEVHFPDGLYISNTLVRSPTHYIGIAGFGLAAISGIVIGMSRYYQVQSLAEGIEPENVRNHVQKFNRASVKYIWFFGINLVLSATCISDDAENLINVVHGVTSVFAFIGFVMFAIVQLDRIEATLVSIPTHSSFENDIEIPLLQTDRTPSRCERSFQLKQKWNRVTMTSGFCLLLCFQILRLVPEDSIPAAIFALMSEGFEVSTVVIGSCMIGMTDFTTLQTLYPHLRYPNRPGPSEQT